MSGEKLRVGVDVATMWTSPEAPRPIDGPATADIPDVRGWLDSMTVQDRLGLHDRTLTQLHEGEPVEVLEEQGDWVKVAAAWQPDPAHHVGYPGWVRRAHLREPLADDLTAPGGTGRADRVDIMASARRHLGLPYLWAGTTPAGLDCSGLVHLSYREAGVIVPRDAGAQMAAAVSIDPGQEEPGDLYFFGSSPSVITHVGFVTGHQTLLHAPEDGTEPGTGVIEEGPVHPGLALQLMGVGRFLD